MGAMRVPVLVAMVALGAVQSASAQSAFQRQLDASLQRLEDTVASSFGRAVPVPSASAGVQYEFDPATGNFQRDPTTFGQVFLDRADPIGKGRVNLSFSYAYLQLDELDGKP